MKSEEIDKKLRTRKEWTVAELATDFGVSVEGLRNRARMIGVRPLRMVGSAMVYSRETAKKILPSDWQRSRKMTGRR